MNFKLIVLVVLILSANTARAQTKGVFIADQPSEGFRQAAVSALETRIMGTTRYTLTTQVKAELQIAVVCLDMANIANHVTGGVCSYTVTYFPKDLAGLSVVMDGPAISSGGEPSQIGEAIFQDFVRGSTEDDLKKARGLMLTSIAVYEVETNNLLKP
jgi:hypothetical protein